MEYQYHQRRGVAPWVWVLVVLAAIALILVIWWAVAAQGPEETIVVTPPEREIEQPPVEQPSAEQPAVVERERPINIYIEREEPQPRVIIVPQGQQPPEARERLRQVNLPGRFRYQGKIWEPSDEAVMGDAAQLKDTGANIDGDIIYAGRDDEQPYDELYLETEPGSGIYIKYESVSGTGSS